MFIDAHDLTAFGIIAGTAGCIGVLAAWRLARRIRVDTDALGELSRSIADGNVPEVGPEASVTELGRLGEQLSTMSRQLGEAHERELALERSRRELVAWVSHDLRSPLASIRATAEALEDGVVDDPDDVQRYLRSIGTETDRLTLLVDDLFELSRISAGSIDLSPQPVEVASLVTSVLDGVRPAARSRGVELRAELGEHPPLLASPAEAARVLRNLVDNAVRHTPRGGTVEVTVDRRVLRGGRVGGRRVRWHPRRGPGAGLRRGLPGRRRSRTRRGRRRAGPGHRQGAGRGPGRLDRRVEPPRRVLLHRPVPVGRRS